jgi:3-oxoacyl-(acyl-carrier-protein) synthase
VTRNDAGPESQAARIAAFAVVGIAGFGAMRALSRRNDNPFQAQVRQYP